MSSATNRLLTLLTWLSISSAGLAVVFVSGCATNPVPDAAGPNALESTYPLLLSDKAGDRREAALADWTTLAQDHGITNPPAPEFQPVTSTLRSLPLALTAPLRLSRLGEGGPMNEEETRESLRRFISRAGPLLCGEAQQLSLIQRIDGADGVKHALYQQRPFRYALRGGYGEMRISFTADRRIVGLSSTCIPETERLRRGFAGLGQQRIPIETIVDNLVGRTAQFIDASGRQSSYIITGKASLRARELVILPIPREGEPAILEIHMVWEINVENLSGLKIYVDSINGDILNARLEPGA